MPNLIVLQPRPATPEEVYQHSPDFRALVDTMEMQIMLGLFTALDFQVAAALACVHIAQKGQA